MKSFVFSIVIVFLLISCKKILHEEILSISKIDSKEELVDATNGLYGLFRPIIKPYKTLNRNGDDLSFFNREYVFYGKAPSCIDINPYREGTVVTTWDDYYLLIAGANNIILQFNNDEKDISIKEIYGEAYFLRAYTYILLTQKFGKVPIIDNLNITYTNGLDSFQDIYKFIENDLKVAINLLPKNNISARIPYVTPNQGTAKAVLAEHYLSWAGYPIKDIQKYADAARVAGEVIDNASYFGFELLPDFADLWKKNHLYNNESIFSLYCDSTIAKADPNDYKFYDGTFPGAEINFFNNYPTGYRKEITFRTFEILYKFIDNPEPYRNPIIVDSTILYINKVDHCNRVSYLKFIFDPTIKFSQIGRHVDPRNNNGYDYELRIWLFGICRNYMLRFAQTMLTYSEAMARSGQLNDKAYEYVNMIRRRARHLPLSEPSVYDLQKGLTPEVFADSVVWERAWELCAENDVRWNDLRRLELVEKLPEMRNELEGGPPARFDKSVYYEPIPARDVSLNPNLAPK